MDSRSLAAAQICIAEKWRYEGQLPMNDESGNSGMMLLTKLTRYTSLSEKQYLDRFMGRQFLFIHFWNKKYKNKVQPRALFSLIWYAVIGGINNK